MWNVLARGRYDFSYDLMPIQVRGMSLRKRWNLFKSGVNLVRRFLTPFNLPLHMQIELTNYCDLRCPICPTGIRELQRRPAAISVEMFESLMKQVGSYLLTMSLWGWGEPLLHPHLTDILRIAHEYPVAALLSTNGQKLSSPKVIDALADYPPAHLIVALDGLTDETNSQFRVGARLAPALEGVRQLAEIKKARKQEFPILHMRYIHMKHNEHEQPRLVEFAREHGFDFLSTRSLLIIDSTHADEAAHKHWTFLPESQDQRAYEYEDNRRIHRNDFVCQQPFWFPTVLADGTVTPCDQDHNAQLPLGIFTDHATFRDIWFSEQARRVRRRIRDEAATCSFCVNCPFADRPTSACSLRAFDLRS
jgi:radical SAM protein with 4Fe4S-binding SPASM domain